MACSISPADWNRSPGSLASALEIRFSNSTGISGTARRTDGTRASTCCNATATGLSPVNGSFPVIISYRTTPSEYRSDLAETFPFLACSGDKYEADPTTTSVEWLTPSQGPCNPEVGYLDVANFCKQDVLRFDIPVDDIVVVGMGKA